MATMSTPPVVVGNDKNVANTAAEQFISLNDEDLASSNFPSSLHFAAADEPEEDLRNVQSISHSGTIRERSDLRGLNQVSSCPYVTRERPSWARKICYYYYHFGYCHPKRGGCYYVHSFDTQHQEVSVPPSLLAAHENCQMPLCKRRREEAALATSEFPWFRDTSGDEMDDLVVTDGFGLNKKANDFTGDCSPARQLQVWFGDATSYDTSNKCGVPDYMAPGKLIEASEGRSQPESRSRESHRAQRGNDAL
jgi:hypothetical protein